MLGKKGNRGWEECRVRWGVTYERYEAGGNGMLEMHDH